MLNIRQEQINSLGAHRFSLYVSDLAQYCRGNFPGSVQVLESHSSVSSLAEFIETSILDAESFGLVSSKNISEFILLALRLYPLALREFEWTSSIFSQTDKNNTSKIAELTTAAELEIDSMKI